MYEKTSYPFLLNGSTPFFRLGLTRLVILNKLSGELNVGKRNHVEHDSYLDQLSPTWLFFYHLKMQ